MSDTHYAPVDDYPERSYEEAKAPEVEVEHVDQIADYHEKNPTLQSGDAHTFPPPTPEDLGQTGEQPEPQGVPEDPPVDDITAVTTPQEPSVNDGNYDTAATEYYEGDEE